MVNLYSIISRSTSSRSEAFDVFNSQDLLFLIDGIAYDSMRTTIRYSNLANESGERIDSWWVNYGFFLEPEALSVGTHNVLVVVFDNAFCPPPSGCGLGDVSNPDEVMMGLPAELFEPWDFEILAESDPHCIE
jgi:hypothetical protein